MATYTGVSIVDYLKSVGQPSDYTSRATLATQKGIANYTGTAEQNTQLLNLLRGSTPMVAPTTAPVTTKTPTTAPVATPIKTTPDLTTIAAGVKQAQETFESIKKQAEPIIAAKTATPTTTAQVQPAVQATTPTLPTPIAPTVQEQYTQSALTTLQVQQDAYQKALDKQLADTKAQRDDVQAELDDLRKQQKEAITDQGTAAIKEKQQKLDYLEEEKARFDENYDIVQGLASQLQDILTTGNALIQQQKGETGLAAIRTPRVNQTISDVAAQAGVLQATISVYNGQMSQAQSQLVNASNVITSAFADQIDYYKTLVNFYESEVSETGEKLITLTKDEKGYLDSQITYLENQMNLTQANVENIKNLMTSPESALFLSKAGVTLNDPPAVVAEKIATQTQRNNVEETINNYVTQGYEYVPFPQAGQDLMTISVGGQSLAFKKPPATIETPIPTQADVATTLYNVGIPSSVASTKGILNKSYYDKMISAGLSAEVIDGIWQNIIATNTFEEIRQGIRNQGGDSAILDTFVQILQGAGGGQEIKNPF